MTNQQLERKLNNILSEIRDISHKLNTLLIVEYGVPEVAAELNLSSSSVYKISPLELPFFKRGKFRRYRREDVLLYKKQLEGKYI